MSGNRRHRVPPGFLRNGEYRNSRVRFQSHNEPERLPSFRGFRLNRDIGCDCVTQVDKINAGRSADEERTPLCFSATRSACELDAAGGVVIAESGRSFMRVLYWTDEVIPGDYRSRGDAYFVRARRISGNRYSAVAPTYLTPPRRANYASPGVHVCT